jgi:hypothetical protein
LSLVVDFLMKIGTFVGKGLIGPLIDDWNEGIH